MLEIYLQLEYDLFYIVVGGSIEVKTYYNCGSSMCCAIRVIGSEYLEARVKWVSEMSAISILLF